MKRKITVNKKEYTDALEQLHSQGGWLVLYEHGASLDRREKSTAYITCCATASDAEAHCGGELLFEDDLDLPEEFCAVLSALANWDDGQCPRIGYLYDLEIELV